MAATKPGSEHAAKLVAESPLGAELSPGQHARLAALASVRRVPAGEYLFEEGTRDDSIHVVLSGAFEVVRKAGVGEVTSLAVLRPRDLAGEMSFVDGAEHQVGLRAVAEGEVLSLRRADFETLLHADPEIVYKTMRNVIRAAHARLRRMNLQYIELSNYIFKQHGRY